MKDKITASPIVEFNLRASKLHKFFKQYEALHKKHKQAMDEIVAEAKEQGIVLADLEREARQVKAQKAIQGFKGDDWMQKDEE
jgi:hypothetical protein